MTQHADKKSAGRLVFIDGVRLKALREEMFKRKEDVSDALGMKERNYARIESKRKAGMFRHRFPLLAAFFGVGTEELERRIVASDRPDPLTLSDDLSAEVRDFAARENREPLEWLAWAVRFCEPKRPGEGKKFTPKGGVLPHRGAEDRQSKATRGTAAQH